MPLSEVSVTISTQRCGGSGEAWHRNAASVTNMAFALSRKAHPTLPPRLSQSRLKIVDDFGEGQKKKPPEGGLSVAGRDDRSGDAKRLFALFAAVSHKANASKAQDHHRPS
jgi:hypothetical protein